MQDCTGYIHCAIRYCIHSLILSKHTKFVEQVSSYTGKLALIISRARIDSIHRDWRKLSNYIRKYIPFVRKHCIISCIVDQILYPKLMKLNATATYYAYSRSFVSMKIVRYSRMYNYVAIYSGTISLTLMKRYSFHFSQ